MQRLSFPLTSLRKSDAHIFPSSPRSTRYESWKASSSFLLLLPRSQDVLSHLRGPLPWSLMCSVKEVSFFPSFPTRRLPVFSKLTLPPPSPLHSLVTAKMMVLALFLRQTKDCFFFLSFLREARLRRRCFSSFLFLFLRRRKMAFFPHFSPWRFIALLSSSSVRIRATSGIAGRFLPLCADFRFFFFFPLSSFGKEVTFFSAKRQASDSARLLSVPFFFRSGCRIPRPFSLFSFSISFPVLEKEAGIPYPSRRRGGTLALYCLRVDTHFPFLLFFSPIRNGSSFSTPFPSIAFDWRTRYQIRPPPARR